MRFRKLRIAWSVFWGVACILLIVLWVRSYWRYDKLHGSLSTSREVAVVSLWGDVCINSPEPKDKLMPWRIVSERIEGPAWENEKKVTESLLRSGPMFRKGFFISHNGHSAVAIPHWLFAFFTIAIAIPPWLPFRFSLRTLLIATTLVAVVLGAVIYAAR